MDDLIILGGLMAVFFMAIIIGFTEGKKQKKALLHKLQEEYGKSNSRKWKPGDIERIAYYTKIREKSEREGNPSKGLFTIDELTWNDLSMDDIFCQMAYTGSSLGDDCLYHLLHHPLRDKRKLTQLEKKITYYQEHEDERLKLQLQFFEIGRLESYSLSRYIQYMQEIEPGKNLVHHLANGFLFFSLLFMISYTLPGLVLFFGCLSYNFISYFRYKREMEPCLASFRYLLSLLVQGEKIVKTLSPVWQEERDELEHKLEQFKSFRKNAYWITSGKGRGAQELELVLDYLRMCFHVDILMFNSMLRQLQHRMDALWALYAELGELDSCLAIGSYRASLPYWCSPKITTNQEVVLIDGYHPLVEKAVPNSLQMDKNILLTGSNASGKSTFLKMMGINILLSQTIHTCLANRMELPFCCIYTAISLQDNVRLKESYYMAEIRAIKRILDSSEGGEQIVCMIDEVLRGTNTIERIAASTQILRQMKEKGILCIAATHDGELTKILEKEYGNYHFEEELLDGDVYFSYRLKPGIASGSNAIQLLSKMGYERSVVDGAQKMIERYKQQGEWK